MIRPRPLVGVIWHRYRADAGALVSLAVLVATIYRSHLAGDSLYLGNFDRLNSFLNTLLFHVRGWRAGHFSAWDDSMFMGRNTFALPFTYPNPLNRLVAILPPDSFYWVSGYISIGLLVLAGWSAYLFIGSLVSDRVAAFVGAALYQFSALAVLKVSQNDMSFAVLIQIPLLLWLARGVEVQRWRWRFAGLCLVLTHLFFFCFLQKAAYAVLILGSYAIFLTVNRRCFYPLAVVAAAGMVAVVAAFPRIYGIAQEMGQLQRQVTPDFKMQDFDALYTWQGFQHVDVFRWFYDGLFGRYYGEMEHLHNHINITEGMLMFTGTLVPFVVLAGLGRWRGRWFGIFRRSERETLFFYGVVAAVFAVVGSKQAYHILFEMFLRVDFTHTRVVIAGLPLICAITSARLAQLRPSLAPSTVMRLWLAGSAALVAILLQAGIGKWSGQSAFAAPIPFTASGADLLSLVRATACHLVGLAATSAPPHGEILAWLLPRAPGEILLSAFVVVALLTTLRLTRACPTVNWWAYALFGSLLVTGAWSFANFQVNNPAIHSLEPYADNNSYAVGPAEFRVPHADEINRIHRQLETDAYRTVFYDTQQLPVFVSPQLGAFWQLRQIDGYSSGVPQRLAALPWPPGALGLRTLTFGGFARPGDLPWPLLAFLNVKYAVRPSLAFYKNQPNGTATSAGNFGYGIAPEQNSLAVVPRVFFARHARIVPNAKAALAAIVSGGSSPKFINPVEETVVESDRALPHLGVGGPIQAVFSGDEIQLSFAPASDPRLLVLDELYHPSWKATAEGRAIAVLPANLVMRAVVVPAGVSSLDMQFEPFCRARNILLFLVAAGGLAGLAAGTLCPIESSCRAHWKNHGLAWKDRLARGIGTALRKHRKLTIVALVYLIAASALLVRSNGLPYGSDGNETFSSAIHARNLSQFPWRIDYGLTDESYGIGAASHPFIHSHQGNFPRLFTYLLYILGAHTVESQVTATAFTAGLAAIILAFLFFSRAVNTNFAVIGCLVFISDYFLFGQWHLNTYRVWHCFFFFSSLLCALSFCRKPSRIAALVTVINFACLCYWEYVFAFFVLGLVAIYAALMGIRRPRRVLGFLALEAAGALVAAGTLAAQLTAYMGWANVRQDISYTLYARNSARDPSFIAQATTFYAKHKVLWWPNYVDAAPLRHVGAFFDLLLRCHLEYYGPWLAFLMIFTAAGWLLTQSVLGRRNGWRLPLAGGVLILAGFSAFHWRELFDWSQAPLWRAAGWPTGGWPRTSLVGMALLVPGLMIAGPKLVARRRARAAGRALAFVGVGLVAFAITYRIFTGYVYSGYLNRQAPFLVFVSDPLLALAFYLPASMFASTRARWNWGRRLTPSASSWRGAVWPAAAAASVWIGLSLMMGWLMLQREYFRVMPPDRYDFIKQLAEPPFRNASFVVNTYAAPMAFETRSWAYLEPIFFGGTLRLTRHGFQLDREDTYKWFADVGTNPTYENPDYALMVRSTGWNDALASYQHAQGIGPPPTPLADTFGLLRRASGPFSTFLHNTVVATDANRERDGFSIVRLDWDYPAYLRPLLANDSVPDIESAQPIDKEWFIEIQSVPTTSPPSQEGEVGIVAIATERESLNLTSGTLHDAGWAPVTRAGKTGPYLKTPSGIPARLQATVGGEDLHVDLQTGPLAGRARIMINDMVGEVDLRSPLPGIKSLRFNAAKSFVDPSIRPAPIAGEYVALKRSGPALQLAYQFKHQQNLPEENTRIDFSLQDELGRRSALETVVLLGKTGIPIDLFAFTLKNPDTVAECLRVQRLGDPRDYLQWLADFLTDNPDERHRAGVLAGAVFTGPAAGPTDPPVRHLLLPLPPATLGAVTAWVRPGTRSKLGPIYPSNTVYLAGLTKGRVQEISGNAFENRPPPVLGGLDLEVKFPVNHPGQSDPLVTTGKTGAGDFVYVVYVDPHHIRIGFDHWGVGGFVSPPILLDYQSSHHLRIFLGSLFPPDSDPQLRGLSLSEVEAIKDRVWITIDNQIALDADAETYEAMPATVTIGQNAIGGSTTTPQFTGQILHSERILNLRPR